MEAYVAHNCGGNLVVLKAAFAFQHFSADGYGLVAVKDSSLFVGHYESVCIAVKGQTYEGTFLNHPFLKLFGMGGTAAVINVYSVGSVADGYNLCSETFVHAACHLIGCTVGTVQHNFLSVKAIVGSLNQVLSVELCRTFFGLQALAYEVSGNVAVDIYAAYYYVLNFFLDEVIKLEALRVEKLYSVVFKGVVRGADYYSCIGFVVSRQISHRRSRNNSHLDYVSPYSQNSRRQSVFKHIAGHSGVLSYNNRRSFVFSA